MNKIVAFDVDGVILNSFIASLEGTKRLLLKYELSEIPEEQYYKFAFPDVEVWFDEIANFLGIDKVILKFNDFYEEITKIPQKLYDGIIEAIKIIKANGYKICILSNSMPDRYNNIVVPHLKDIEFDYIRLRDFDPNEPTGRHKLCKPNPAFLDKVLEHFSCKPSDIIYIGDLFEDYEFAKSTGMQFIWAAYGQDNGRLAKIEGLHKVEKPSELLDMIKSLGE